MKMEGGFWVWGVWGRTSVAEVRSPPIAVIVFCLFVCFFTISTNHYLAFRLFLAMCYMLHIFSDVMWIGMLLEPIHLQAPCWLLDNPRTNQHTYTVMIWHTFIRSHFTSLRANHCIAIQFNFVCVFCLLYENGRFAESHPGVNNRNELALLP